MKRPRTVDEWMVVTVGSALGLGLAPIAPGSFGALLGVGIHIGLLACFGHVILWALGASFAGICVVHTVMTPAATRFWGDDDPKHFVLDEVAGYLLVALITTNWVSPIVIAVEGFLLFRILDIIKPPPARQIDDQMHGSMGVLLDDLVAAIYASGLLLAQHWLVGRIGG